MRLFKATILAVAALFLSTAMASANIHVTTNQNDSSWAVGDFMLITVTVTNDANISELGISASWNPAQWGNASGVASQAGPIWDGTFQVSYYGTTYTYATGGLLRSSTPFCAPIDDCNSELRLVQYSSPAPPVSPGLSTPPGGYYYGVAGVQTFRLKLQALAPGTSDIIYFQNTGDEVSNPGSVVLFTSDNTTNVTVVPEPGTALLMGLGLVGLGVAGRRNR
jgi:hypothetical protein